MAVLTLTINDPTFDRKSAEIAYLRRVLELASNEIGRGGGVVTSGSIIGTNHAGLANTSLGAWTYSPSASKP